MKGIFIRTLKDNWKKLTIYILVGLLFVLMYASMYPSIKDQADEFQKLFESYPQELFTAMGIKEALFDTFVNFLGLEHFSIIWPLIAILISVGMAISIFARDIENKVMHLYLSQPITRVQTFVSKYLAGVLMVMIFVVGSLAPIEFIANLFDVTISGKSIIYVTFLGILFSLAIYSLAVLFSVLTQQAGKASGASSGVLVLMYALNVLASLNNSYMNAKYLSFFYYFDYKMALSTLAISTETIIVFSVSIFISFLAGLLVFSKKDL